MGGGSRRIIARHIVPNTIGTIIVNATFQVADAIIILATLEFLGFSLPPPTPTWGGMLSDGTTFLQDGYWWQVYPALIIIVLTVVSFNFIGDALRDTFDVRLQTNDEPSRGSDGLADRDPPADAATVHAVDGISFRRRRGRDGRHRGRVRLRQDDDRDVDHASAAPGGVIAGGQIRFDGRDLVDADRGRDAERPGQRHRHGVPGPDDVAQPDHDRSAIRSPKAFACIGTYPRQAALERAVEVLDLVGMPTPRGAASTITPISCRAGCASGS